MTNEEREQRKRILDRSRRALSHMEEQAAGYTTLTIPTDLKLNLEDKRKEVAELEQKLEESENAPSDTTANGVYSHLQPEPSQVTFSNQSSSTSQDSAIEEEDYSEQDNLWNGLWGSRVKAAIIDISLLTVIQFFFTEAFSENSLILYFLLEIWSYWYLVLVCYLFTNATVGMLITGLNFIDSRENRPNIKALSIRYIIGFLSIHINVVLVTIAKIQNPPGWLIFINIALTLGYAIFDSQKQGLHDKVSGVYIFYK